MRCLPCCDVSSDQPPVRTLTTNNIIRGGNGNHANGSSSDSSHRMGSGNLGPRRLPRAKRGFPKGSSSVTSARRCAETGGSSGNASSTRKSNSTLPPCPAVEGPRYIPAIAREVATKEEAPAMKSEAGNRRAICRQTVHRCAQPKQRGGSERTLRRNTAHPSRRSLLCCSVSCCLLSLVQAFVGWWTGRAYYWHCSKGGRSVFRACGGCLIRQGDLQLPQ